MKIKEIISNSIRNRDALGLRYIKSSMAGYDLMVHPKDWRFWSEVNKKNWEPETIEFMVDNVFRGMRWPRFLDHWPVKISDGCRGLVGRYRGIAFRSISFWDWSPIFVSVA